PELQATSIAARRSRNGKELSADPERRLIPTGARLPDRGRAGALPLAGARRLGRAARGPGGLGCDKEMGTGTRRSGEGRYVAGHGGGQRDRQGGVGRTRRASG